MQETESMSKRLLTALMNPKIYPHPSTSVDLVETHISWVLLTGLRAYKIKKPVDLGFVDFTTLERRRHFCEEEIRLNRRLAPNLYQDVVPITGSLEAPQIDGEGPIIEYAVRMKQFNKSQVLDGTSLRNINVQQMETLADDCAAFHEEIATLAPKSPFGTPSEILKPVVANLDILRDTDNSLCESVADLRERVDYHFERLIPAFKHRRQCGRVRECHGDLHLGNLFLHGDRITVFDGIEFNDSFRWIDVASDIAFLIMDLTVHGHHALANRFLNRWLERTGDYDGLRVLSFYCAYRATVRAKIDVIRVHQPDVTYSDQQHLARACGEYLELAKQFLIQHAASLTITMGLSGSGKTTVTDHLLETSNTIRIRSDVERKRMYGLGLLEASDDETKSRMYSDQSAQAAYQRLEELATTAIQAGYPVVVDATFLKHEQRQQFSRLADNLGVPFTIIHCRASEGVLRERVRRRQADRRDASEADDAVLDTQMQTAELLTSTEALSTIEFSERDQKAAFEELRRKCGQVGY